MSDFEITDLMLITGEFDGIQCIGNAEELFDTQGGFRINDDKL